MVFSQLCQCDISVFKLNKHDLKCTFFSIFKHWFHPSLKHSFSSLSLSFLLSDLLNDTFIPKFPLIDLATYISLYFQFLYGKG